MMQASEARRWVFCDETGGAPCQDGTILTPAILGQIAEACTIQLNRDYGCDDRARAGTSDAIQPGERLYIFRNGLPEAPGALAYHAVDGSGVEFGFEDWSSCSSATGPGGASVGASHECLETKGDPGCNQSSNDGQGTLHANERCDACETQWYPITISDGTAVFVSNFLLDAWYIPGHPPPYTYMTANGIEGGVECPGPMLTAPGHGGNYQSVQPDPGGETQIFALRKAPRIIGTPRRPEKTFHWSSRIARRHALLQ
jgi:hypothetical protein